MYKILRDLKNIYDKFAFVKIDIPAVVNSTVLFLLAWFSAFWIFQFFTIVPAFSIGAKMLVYTSEIDFNSVNTASSDAQIWSDPDNIINIFGTPVIMLTILIIVAIIFLCKWNTDRLNVRRFLFWLIVCSSVRISGNYIAGSLFGNSFNIWQWNLVTDFLYITTSVFLKYTFVVLMLMILYIPFKFMSNQIKLLFNPYFANRINNLISSIFFPMLIGSVFIIFYNITRVSVCEITCVVLMFLFTSFVMCKRFIVKYRGIAEEIEEEDAERINIIPIIILVLLVLLKVYVDIIRKGIFISSTLYKRFLLENIILISVVLVLIVVLTIAVRIYSIRRKKNELVFLKSYVEQREFVERGLSEETYKNFGVEAHTEDMSKYLKGWVESLNQTEESQLADSNIDNDEKNPSAKEIDLDKYKERWEKSLSNKTSL